MSYINTTTGNYPLSAADVRAAFPNTSFPAEAAEFEAAIAEMGYAVVQQVPQPVITYAQNSSEGTPVESGGTYEQTWVISDATAEEVAQRIRANADYIIFWDALTTSTVYAAIRNQSFASLPMNTLATEFIALLGDAKAGRPNETTIQASINAILATGTFTEAHLIELQAALATGHLNAIYTLPVSIPGDG